MAVILILCTTVQNTETSRMGFSSRQRSLNKWPVYFSVIIVCRSSAILIWCLEEQGMLLQPTWPPHTHQAEPTYDWFVYIQAIKTNPQTLCPCLILLWPHCFLLSSPDCLLCSCCCFGVQRSDAALLVKWNH